MVAMPTEPDSVALRRDMVAALELSGDISTGAVRDAFLAVPREHFVAGIAAKDGLAAIYDPSKALVTATDRSGHPVSSSSATAIMAPMLESLELAPGMRVLEIGAGTGYNAALLGHLVGPTGQVTTIDIDAPIARKARRALGASGYPAQVVVGDGRGGWPLGAPFDRIIATASSPEVAPSWFDQLKEGGLLVVPLRFTPYAQAVVAFCRRGEVLRSTRVIPGGFMPLRGAAGYSPSALEGTLSAAGPAGADPFVFLAGPCLAAIPLARQRQILSCLLSPGRRLPGLLRADEASALNLFLTLHPNRRLVMSRIGSRFGAGIIDPRSPAFAALSLHDGEPGWITAWGAPSAEHELLALLGQWDQLGRPGPAQLHIDSFPGGPHPRRRCWRALVTTNSTLVLEWGGKEASCGHAHHQLTTAGPKFDGQTPSRRLRELIERLLAERRATARSDGSTHELFPVAIGGAEGTALRETVIGEGATTTIEVGLGYGLPTLFVCEGLLSNGHPAARHLAIDPHQERRFANCGLQFLEEAGVAELVEHHRAASQIVLPRLVEQGRTFDLAFVDGNHRFDGVFVDLVYLARLVKAGGIVFLDDYQLPAVARAASFFVNNLGWRVEDISGDVDGHWWAVLRTSDALDTRSFDDYIDF